MPGFDGMGPAGMGSMTGRGMGYCGTGMGRGRAGGRSFGRGRGRGQGYSGFGFTPAAPVSRESELDFLKRRAEALEADLAETRRFMEQMETEESE